MMMTMTTGAKPPHRRPLALLALLLSIATCHSSSSVDYYSTAEEFEPEVVPGSARFRFLQSNANTCNVKELLVNGDIETGTLEGWQRWGGGNGHVIEITEGYHGGSAIISKSRRDWYGPSQDLNLDCIKEGDLIAVTGRLKLENNGVIATCNTRATNSARCPFAFLRIRNPGGVSTDYKIGYVTHSDPDENGWYQISGLHNVRNTINDIESSNLRIESHTGADDIIIDDFKLYKKPFQCANLAHTGFEFPDEYIKSRFEYTTGPSGDLSAIRVYNRAATRHGAAVFIDVRCMVAGLTYLISAKFKLEDTSGNPQSCDPSKTDLGSSQCPTVVLKGFDCDTTNIGGIRYFNEVALTSWNKNGFNDFGASFTVTDHMASCSEIYVIIGRDVPTNRNIIVDDIQITGDVAASAMREITIAPTDNPTTSPTESPSTSPTPLPTNQPTSFPTVSTVTPCPEPGEAPLELSPGPVMLTRSNTLCILTKALVGADGSLSQVAPVARSYDGGSWRKSAGGFATTLLHGIDFDQHIAGSQLTLPALGADEKYYLASYSYTLSENDSVARFLNTATFGVTTDELNAWQGPVTKESAAEWIQQQLDEPPTSHRAYLRKGMNPRMTTPDHQFIPDHPCDAGSRWRKYTFSKKDGHQYWYHREIGLIGDGPYVITLDGQARTTVDKFPWKKHWLNLNFDQSKTYSIANCNTPEEKVGGIWYIRGDNNVCTPLYNPPIYFDTNVTHLPNPVVSLPAIDNGLEVIDAHKDSNGEEFILVDGLNGAICSQLPDVHHEKEAPIFGQLPDGTWLQFDPRADLTENTIENPLTDGGGILPILTDDVAQCSNVARTPFNEHGCKLSMEPTSCTGTYNRATIPIDLNADSIIAIHNITGIYIYAVTNIPLGGDNGGTIDSACKPHTKSRWEIKPSNECVATELDNATSSALGTLLANSPDTNAFVRDITFPEVAFPGSCSVNSTASLEEVSIIIGAQCFHRVHPQHMSVFDMTDCTRDGNPCLLNLADGHPIKKPMDVDENVFFDYSGQSNSFWDNEFIKFTNLGRFGDTIKFRDLTNDLSLDEIAKYFGASTSGAGRNTVVCGSKNEISSEKSLGDKFSLGSVSNRERIWAMIALESNDQLRQRVAWALAQILVLVPDQIESIGWSQSEVFLHYYDIFVQNAFGNYRDVLREVTFSPLMADNLSYLGSKSGAYNYEKNGVFTFADENFAREIMQLFSVGLNLLNIDGTDKLDDDGNPIETYTNDEIMSMARVFTGFVRQAPRGNYEEEWDRRNMLDHMTIVPSYHDMFPKSDLTGGYIGDGYPLCVDLPSKMFIRKGATYKLLGDSPSPQAFEDPSSFNSDPTVIHFVLDENSLLREKLCNSVGGKCQFHSIVTLDSNIECTGRECDADEIRVVQVGNVFYEFVRPACVEQVFYNNAKQVTYLNRFYHQNCANPRLAYASEACKTDRAKYTRIAVRYSNYIFDGERVLHSTGQARCQEDGFEQSWFHFFEDLSSDDKKGYFWTNDSCEIKVKVNSAGLVSVVYDANGSETEKHVTQSYNENYFKVFWNGDFPSAGNSCGNGACSSLDDGGCLCSTTVAEEAVFSEMPMSTEDIFSELYIGAYDPSAYDHNTYNIYTNEDITVYLVNDEYSSNTVFEATDHFGRVRLMKNSREIVNIAGGTDFSFRSAPSFMSMLSTEKTTRDAINEIDATIAHLFYHENTAPFIATRLIQRFVTSNPDPSYVSAVATAFQTGKYAGFGSGKYGDLASTISAVLLEPDAQSVVLDVDPFHGSVREPLLKVMAVMRSMELEMVLDKKVLQLDFPMVEKIGQFAHSFPSVFSFFLPEHVPIGRPGAATLLSPETMLADMPKITGLLNGLYSMIKYGVSQCNNGFGSGGTISCQEGDFSNAVAKLSFVSNSDADVVVDELATLLTSGRLGSESRQIIKEAYTNKLPDQAAALRIAQQLIIASPEFHTTNTVRKSGNMRVPAENPPASGVPYKAVIMIMLAGGADSYNMLIPHTCASSDLYGEYVNVRKQIAISPKDKLLEIDATSSNQVCESFGLHPKLAAAAQLYNDGDLLFFANAGVLTKPSDKDNYKHTKTQLFAHNSMQREIEHIDPYRTSTQTGILGRVSDVLFSQQQLSVGRFNIYDRAESLEGLHGAEPFIIDASGIPKFNQGASIEDMAATISNLNGATEPDSGVFADLWSDNLLNSIGASEMLTTALSGVETLSSFSDDSYGKAMKMISKIIATREHRGVDRDFFFFSVGGWDAHKQVGWNLDTNLSMFDSAIQAFSNEMKSTDLWDSTTIIQTSDFGRTLESNGGDGSDHAWGGHYMMMGGGVKGGQILGKYPEKLTEGGSAVLDRGRMVPTTSWDAIFQPIAEWAGVSPESIADICPNIGNFPESDRFQATDLFENI